MSTAAKRVLVTGASGFVAGHVIKQFLSAGYIVRGTARKSSLERLKQLNIPNFEVCEIEDIGSSSFQEAFKDVDALLHVATSLPGKSSQTQIYNESHDGAQHILNEALKAGVHKIVLTGTYGNVLPSEAPPKGQGIFDESVWKTMSKEDILKMDVNDAFGLYFAGKILQENMFWDFAEKHKDLIDLRVILPAYIYGPWAQGLPYPTKPENMGTNGYIHALTNGTSISNTEIYFVDVRDVAKAHLRAFELPKAPKDKIRDHRFLVGHGNYLWQQAALDAKAVCPVEVNIAKEFANVQMTWTGLNFRSQQVLGMEYIAPSKTVKDVLLSIREVQASWANNSKA